MKNVARRQLMTMTKKVRQNFVFRAGLSAPKALLERTEVNMDNHEA
jgi:hypothetical protein